MLRVLERARRSEGRNYLVFVGVGGDRLKVDFVTGDRNSVLVQTDPQAESAILVNLNEALRRLHQ